MLMQFNFYVRRVVINNLVSGSSKGKLNPPSVQQVCACLQKMSQCVAALDKMNSIFVWYACYLHPVCCVDFVWTKCQNDCQLSKKSNVKGKRLDVILSSSGATSAPRVVTWSFGMSEAVECVKPGWAKPNKQSKWKNQMLTSCNPCRPIKGSPM